MMRISFKNVLVNGRKRYEIVDFEMLSKSELPAEYTDDYPYVYKREYTNIDGFKCNNIVYERGELVTSETMREILVTFESAGKKLADINKEIKYLKENWEGITREYNF
jgi:hypothetical protein